MKRIIFLMLIVLSGYTFGQFTSTKRGTEIDSSVAGTFGTKNITASNGIFSSLWANNLSGGVFYGIYSTAYSNSSAFGYSALQYNTNAQSSAFGYQAGRSNTGAKFAGFGYTAGQDNTGEAFAGLGYDCGKLNTGEFVSLLGGYSGWRQSGDLSVGMGYQSLENNNADETVGIGSNTLRYNGGAYNTALGSNAFNTFTPDGATAKTFDYTNILLAGNKIALASHGYTGYVNLIYTEGTSTIGGLTNGLVYNFKVDDADTLYLIYPILSAAGTGTGHTLTASTQRAITNSTAIGYNSEPTASNQIILGNGSVTSVLSGQNGTSGFGAGAITGKGNLSIKPNGTTEKFAVLDTYATLQGVDFSKGSGYSYIDYSSTANAMIVLGSSGTLTRLQTGTNGLPWYIDIRENPAGADGEIRIGDCETDYEYIRIDSTGALICGNPTGGSKGTGTINATAVYDDNVLLTGADFVFSPSYKLSPIKEMTLFYQKNKHLPTIDTWENDESKRPSVGKLTFQLLETVETQARYISELEERLSKIEKLLAQ